MNPQTKDISLHEIANREALSTRTVNICNRNHLYTLNIILNFYQEKGSFKSLRLCGTKAEQELTSLCDKYNDQLKKHKKWCNRFNETNGLNPSENHLLPVLIEKNLISVWSAGSCKRANLLSLNMIIDYYQKNKSFLKIKWCGKIANLELSTFCDKIIKLREVSLTADEKDMAILNWSNHPVNFQEFIDRFNKTALNGSWYIFNDASIQKQIHDFFSPGFHFKNNKHPGGKQEIEFSLIKSEISIFIKKLNAIEHPKIRNKIAKHILEINFPKQASMLKKAYKYLVKNNGMIPLFSLLNKFIDSKYVFKPKEKIIFPYLYSDPKAKNHRHQDIHMQTQINLTNIAQLKRKIKFKIENYLPYLLEFVPEELISYTRIAPNEIFILNQSWCDEIKEKEGVNFNIQFYTMILSILYKNTHEVISQLEPISSKTAEKKLPLKNVYLLNKSLLTQFDFKSFIKDLQSKQKERLKTSYSILLSDYLSQFYLTEDRSAYEEIKSICETILLQEFDINIKDDGWLRFEHNTRKTIGDYVYEVLNEHNRIMNLEEIIRAIEVKAPSFTYSRASLISVLQHKKTHFMSIGFDGTYGLRKWEHEHENIKGGSLSNLVFAFLKDSMRPVPISEVYEYVSKYRVTSMDRIKYALRKDSKRRFEITADGFVKFNSYLGLREWNFRLRREMQGVNKRTVYS